VINNLALPDSVELSSVSDDGLQTRHVKSSELGSLAMARNELVLLTLPSSKN
jgi:hypothetical protein